MACSHYIAQKMFDFIKDIYQTFFRFVRFPCATGFFSIGNPNQNSPILVTCNFDYTVRHLKKYLIKEDINCFLAVLNTQGTNVWCAAVEGVMTTDTLLSLLKVNNVESITKHKQLIIPQLAAAGIKRKELAVHGWTGIYGPVYFQDLKLFLDNGLKRTRNMQALDYGYRERFKMAISHAVFCTLICIVPTVLLASDWWKFWLISIWYLALAMQLIEQFIPIKRLLYKGLIFGLPLVAFIFSMDIPLPEMMRIASITVILSAYIGFDSQGHSHLGQNQHSGKLFSRILLLFSIIYGSTYLL